MTLTEDLISLFMINKQRNEWDHWLDDAATHEFIHKLSIHPDFSDSIDPELAADFLPELFNNFEFASKECITVEEASEFLKLLNRNMTINMADYWIVIPLIAAEATRTIEISDDISIVAGTRKDKIAQLSQMIGLELKELESRVVHTETSRSPHFLEDPLLVIKMNHQRKIVHSHAVAIAYYTINFINVLYWAYIHSSLQPKHNWGLFKHISDKPNQHVMVQSLDQSRWGHSPLHFEYTCNFNLDWLTENVHRNRLIHLMDLIHLNYQHNELSNRFLRGIRFFVRGINVQANNRFFDAESDIILLLNIASECILIQNQSERNKSRKIKGRLSVLADIEDIDLESRKQIIDLMISSRGSYVHEGLSTTSSLFTEEHNTGTELDMYKRIVARFLSKAFELTEQAKITAAQEGEDIEEVFYNSFQN